jgi:glycosyl transferase family 87
MSKPNEAPRAQPRRRVARRVALFAVAAALLAASLEMAASLAGTGTDFVEYWSASRLLLAGHNPYDPAQMDAVQRGLGFKRAEPLLMLNPPWALPFVLPLGAVNYAASQQLWLAFNLALLAASTWLCGRLYFADAAVPAWYALAFSFLPALTCLAIGQISSLALFGLAAFLHLQMRRRDWSAGASLLLAASKPHAVWLLWPALLWWAIRERRWRILGGFAVAMGCATALALRLDPGAFSHYSDVLHSYGVLRREVPTAAGWLIHIWSPQHRWLEAAPMVAGFFWLGWSWPRGGAWRWLERLPGIVLVSLVTSIYGWYFDQVVLLPALFCAAAAMPRRSVSAAARRVIVIGYIAVDIAPAALMLLGFRVFAYAWTAPAWLGLYAAARMASRKGERVTASAG